MATKDGDPWPEEVCECLKHRGYFHYRPWNAKYRLAQYGDLKPIDSGSSEHERCWRGDYRFFLSTQLAPARAVAVARHVQETSSA